MDGKTKGSRVDEQTVIPPERATASADVADPRVASDALRRDKVVTDYETRWAVVGAKGAIDFHFNNKPIGHGFDYIGGLEIHYRTPPDYMADQPAAHDFCHLLCGKCWHDGSSLYASEYLIPLYRNNGEDVLWRTLEREYRERFDVEATPHGR